MEAQGADVVARCRVLDWDTAFFGRRVARLLDGPLAREDAERVVAWARRESVDCVYFLAAESDASSVQAGLNAGFQAVDERVTLTRSLSVPDAPPSPPGSAPEDGGGWIDRARDGDRASLSAIARTSHRDSRFYSDPNFSRERCDALYERWIVGACDGDADVVWVARLGDEAVGYLSGHLDPGGSSRIGLVGVAERARGRALGTCLVETALAHFARAGAREARVVTQRRNTRAQSLYERAGFHVESIRTWLHCWTAAASTASGT